MRGSGRHVEQRGLVSSRELDLLHVCGSLLLQMRLLVQSAAGVRRRLVVVVAAQHLREPRVREWIERGVERRVVAARDRQHVEAEEKEENHAEPAAAATAPTAQQRANLPLAREYVHVLAANQ